MKKMILVLSLIFLSGAGYQLSATGGDGNDPIVITCPPPDRDFGRCHECKDVHAGEKWCVYTGSVMNFCDLGCGWWGW